MEITLQIEKRLLNSFWEIFYPVFEYLNNCCLHFRWYLQHRPVLWVMARTIEKLCTSEKSYQTVFEQLRLPFVGLRSWFPNMSHTFSSIYQHKIHITITKNTCTLVWVYLCLSRVPSTVLTSVNGHHVNLEKEAWEYSVKIVLVFCNTLV